MAARPNSSTGPAPACSVTAHRETKFLRTCLSSGALRYFFVEGLCTSVQAAGISQQEAGRNVSDEVTQVPGLAPSVSIDPDEMTLEEYRAVSGGALPPEYSLAAAAVGAAILIVTIIIVALVTVIQNRFCSKRSRQGRTNSTDQSKGSTSSAARPLAGKEKKGMYRPVATKDKVEISIEMKSQRTRKGDLESRRSSTSAESVTPKDQFVSTSSIPAI